MLRESEICTSAEMREDERMDKRGEKIQEIESENIFYKTDLNLFLIKDCVKNMQEKYC